MSNVTITPNMNLPLPIPGQDPGPDYANQQNGAFTIIDAHDHTPGKGVPITPAAISINTDLSFGGNSATNMKSITFLPQASIPTPFSVYFTGVDAYVTDGVGNVIQLTASGSVNATTSGISSGTASAAFSGGVLVVNSAPNTPANIQVGSVLLGNNVVNSKFLTLSPPAAMAVNYTLTLPPLPSVTSIMALDTSGNITAPYTVDNTTIEISANVIRVKAQGITAAQIANGTITTTQISSTAAIIGTQLSATANILGSQLDPNAGIVPKQLTFSTADNGNQSSSSGTYTSNSTSATTVTNLTGVLLPALTTSTTRPIFITFSGDGTTTNQGSIAIGSNVGPFTATFIVQGVVGITAHTVAQYTMSQTNGTDSLRIPCGALNCIDYQAFNNYRLQVKVSSSNATVSVTGVFMQVVQV